MSWAVSVGSRHSDLDPSDRCPSRFTKSLYSIQTAKLRDFQNAKKNHWWSEAALLEPASDISRSVKKSSISTFRDKYSPTSNPQLQPSHSSRILAQFTMAIELSPLPLPASADPSKFSEFGREVKGVDPGKLSEEDFKQIHDLLYKVAS
jgi:hypothetical protein